MPTAWFPSRIQPATASLSSESRGQRLGRTILPLLGMCYSPSFFLFRWVFSSYFDFSEMNHPAKILVALAAFSWRLHTDNGQLAFTLCGWCLLSIAINIVWLWALSHLGAWLGARIEQSRWFPRSEPAPY